MTLAAATTLAHPDTPWHWAVAIFQIVVIDIVLAGDNAVVIALAVRQLQPRQRLLGLILGAGLAVALRVVLTFFATQLLAVNYIKLVGGVLVFWIAVKLLLDNAHEEGEAPARSASGLWSAVWLILVADITMSIDNVIAVAAASRDSFTLLLFGLALSIPFVVFASNLISKLMDRYPVIIWIGAAILGDVAGEMIVNDRLFFQPPEAPSFVLVHGVGIAAAAGVVVFGWALRRRRSSTGSGN
jgi:YjbE family integral membrane protein